MSATWDTDPLRRELFSLAALDRVTSAGWMARRVLKRYRRMFGEGLL